MGHVCGLAHTFAGSEAYNNYGCPASTNGNPELNGDGVTDTDPHKRAEPYNSCSSESEQQINSCTGRPFGLIGRNYMSYGCATRVFTEGQILRMRTYLGRSQELVNSAYLTPPLASDAVRTACQPTSVSAVTPHSEGVWSVTLEQLNSSTYANGYNNGLNYYDYSCTKKVALTAGQTYSLTIWGWGRHRRVYLDWNDDGLFDEVSERLFSEDRLSNANPETSVAPITLPASAVVNRFLRLRVIVDGGVTPPTACNLPGSAKGSGEAEDYGVLILPTQLCTVIRTVKAGNWQDASIWSCGRLPTLTDTVEVAHAIDLQAGEVGQANRLQYGSGGKLHVAVGAQLLVK